MNTHQKLQSKIKESTTSSLGVVSIWVWTEVDNTTLIGTKPTKEELNSMSNAKNVSEKWI